MTRTLVLWCPDWPVRAVTHTGAGVDLPRAAPVALFERGEVMACSASARADGVRRGQRMRDAQARCPALVTLDYDPALDVRAFEPVLAAVEEIAPGVQPLRPGTCAVRVSGPGRYFGGEEHAAAVLAERLVALGIDDVRFGVADAVFAAEQAARQALPQDSVVVPPGEGGAFLRDLPVGVLDRPELVSLLQRLGLRTLGAFAAVPHADVLTRFGHDGALAHRLARGVDDRPFAGRRPPSDLEREVRFEPPLEDAEAVAFSVRRTAEAFVSAIAARQMVCTSVWVEVHTDRGETSERQWLHPRWFDAADLVDRVRWQLQARPGPAGAVSAVAAPVSAVRFVPADVAPVTDHADGLWGSGADARVHRAASKVQSMLGREAVLSAVVGGGRGPADRQTLVPWGDPPTAERAASPPWPGSMPAPAPATVYDPPRPAQVVGASGQQVAVSERGMVTAAPARFGVEGLDTAAPSSLAARSAERLQPVAAWAGPWPVDERWWDAEQAVRAARFQVVGVDGSAWLLRVSDGAWCVEARYD
ncbi:DNA polymerase Y family protein [Mumia zhuanghuii]|uniref:DNA polymerase Y family protein n=1 Tax=Mumia zhuanghuii TaxID=2585211 RepID=A0A5C4MHB9_9ACTN|nr:DNA polymerase Y family protein [Mumia zhuanghuii]TNC35435.1 DNA polymerase Y family protein [Mumia zhuanghuii]